MSPTPIRDEVLFVRLRADEKDKIHAAAERAALTDAAWARTTLLAAARKDTQMSDTIRIYKLTEEIRECERMLAPGSETSLWGEYRDAMQSVCICRAESPDDCTCTIHTDEAAGWLGAYAALTDQAEDIQDADGDWTITSTDLPAAHYEPAADWVSQVLGRDVTDGEMAKFEAWYREAMHQYLTDRED